MSTPYLIHACIGAIILLGMLIWLAIALYIAKTRTTELADYFPNSPLIKLNTPSKHDIIIKYFRYIGTLAACVTFPSGHVDRAEINDQDLQNLPPHIKRLLKILYCTRIGLIFSLILTYLVGKYGFDLYD